MKLVWSSGGRHANVHLSLFLSEMRNLVYMQILLVISSNCYPLNLLVYRQRRPWAKMIDYYIERLGVGSFRLLIAALVRKRKEGF